jgi:hypothetical protein
MEEESQKITRTPEWSIIRDGLGYGVMANGALTTTNINGEEVVEFIIKVDSAVKKAYNLNRGKELTEEDTMTWIVSRNDLIHLNIYDDTNRIIQYTKSLKHEPTELSRREENLQTLIKLKDKRINLLEAENMRLAEQLMLFRSNPALAVSLGAELFEKSMKSAADLIRPKGRDE